jgi:hypothetical protein
VLPDAPEQRVIRRDLRIAVPKCRYLRISSLYLRRNSLAIAGTFQLDNIAFRVMEVE